MAAAAAATHLPDECWEHVFKFLKYNYEYYELNRDYILIMESLSVVSKQFLSITNRLRHSLTISTQSHHHLYERFPNLTSLTLQNFQGNPLNNLLIKISKFPLKLTSLTLSSCYTIPTNGLPTFSQKITTLTSLTCFNIKSINNTDIFFIADCFPLLEELNLGYTYPYFRYRSIPIIVEPLSLLFKLRKVNLSGHDYIDDILLFHLFKNCKLLEEANLSHCIQLTNSGIASALLERPTLKSLTIHNLKDWAMLFAFTRNCPSLSEIAVQRPRRVRNVENFNSFAVSPQLKSLSFGDDCWLTNKTIKVFALFPNLVRLDLRRCIISEVGINQILKMCCKLRHLNLSYCSRLNVSKINFEVLKLEVLNLTKTSVDDKALHVISKSCCGLLQLILKSCPNVTAMGVKHVVDNCLRLRVINLKNCHQVNADVAALILHSRPSLIYVK